MGDRRDIFNTPDAHPGTGKGPDCSLGTGPGTALFTLTGCTHLDMNPDNSLFTGILGDISCHLHCCVRRPFVPVLLDYHPTAAFCYRLCSGEIGDGDDGIIERSKDVGNSPLFLLVCRHLTSPLPV